MKLNSKQRNILIAGLVIVFLTGAFPPWTYTFKSSITYSEKPAGHYFILDQPSPEVNRGLCGIKIDISTLFIQWIITIVAISIGLLLAAKKVGGVSDEQLKSQEKLREQDDSLHKASKVKMQKAHEMNDPNASLQELETKIFDPVAAAKSETLVDLKSEDFRWQCPRCHKINSSTLFKCPCGEIVQPFEQKKYRYFKPIEQQISYLNWKCPACNRINDKALFKCFCGYIVGFKEQANHATPSKEKLEEESEGLYEAILGEKNRTYYLIKFESFDQKGPGLKASWNWAAFFGGGIWLLYRKMYGWFFVFWGITLTSGLFSAFLKDTGFSVLGFLLMIGTKIAFTILANSIYHGSVKKKIAVTQISARDRSQLLELLHYKGGVHTWIIWVWILLIVTGILAAIAIPQFAAYKQRTHAAAEKADSIRQEEIARQIITIVHPGWEKTVQSKGFKDWIVSQPEEVKAKCSSWNPQDAIYVLDLFKKDAGNQEKTPIQKAPSLSGWNRIQSSKEYLDFNPQERAIIKSEWFKKNIAPTPEFQAYNDADKKTIFNTFIKSNIDVKKPEEKISTLANKTLDNK